MLRTVRDLGDIKGKRVLLRSDFNVPINKDGDILDDTRIVEELPTIEYLLKKGAKLIICSHFGRPKGYDKYLSLFPVAVNLMKRFPNKVKFCEQVVGDVAQKAVENLKDGHILLLENTRFDPREEANDPSFVKQLASYADIFVNDAFGTAHRKHASNYGVAIKLPSCIGFLIEKEIQVFSDAMKHPKHPFVAVFGGAKVDDKLQLLSSIVRKADTLLIGGGMAYTFLMAQGVNIGKSIVSFDRMNDAKNILHEAALNGVKIVLPVDHVALNTETNRVVKTKQLTRELVGLDIGKKTTDLFVKEIAKAEQVLWNGPLGKYEEPKFKKGTMKIAKAIAKSDAYSIVGGGDSVSAVKASGFADQISYLSTGGGASLKLIEGAMLPALEAIDQI